MFGRSFIIPLRWFLAGCVMFAVVGCGSVAPVTFTPPQGAIDLSGTYMIAVTGGGSQGDLGSDPTLVIAAGKLTKLGVTDLSPQSATNTGSNFVWVSAASVVLSSKLPFPVTNTITLNVDLQADKTLVGTMTFAALGQTSQPLNVTLTKQ